MEQKNRNSFVMFRSFIETIKEMSPEDAKAFVIALGDYALDGIEPELSGIVKVAFIASKPSLNNAIIRWEQSVENGKKGAEFGKKGGRPRKGETREMYLERKGLENPSKTPKETPKEKTPVKPLYVDDDVDVAEDVDVFKKPTLNNNYFNKEKEISPYKYNNSVIKESGDFDKGGFDNWDSCFENENYYEKQDGELVFENGSNNEKEQECSYWA